MSTISTTNLKHPSSAVNNLVLNSSGTVSATSKILGAGLDHITTQTFSSVSSVSVNNCFTSSYSNYHIHWDFIASGTAQEFQARLRSAGADYTSANYFYQGVYNWSTSVVGSRSTSQTKFRIGSIANISRNAGDIVLYNPALPIDKNFISRCIGNADGSSNLQFDNIAGGIVATQGYDGITIYPTNGTITGTIRIYGFEAT